MNVKTIISIIILSKALNAFTINDWKMIQNAETLSVFLNNQSAGQLQTSLKVKDSCVVTESIMKTELSGGGSGALIKATIIERREYDKAGHIVRAYQEINSPAGKNFWNLERSVIGRWVLKVTSGGIENSREIKNVNDEISNTYQMYKGLINSNIKVGTLWNDTVTELTSGEKVFQQTSCVETPNERNGNTWKFTERNSVNEKDEVWVIDKNGNTVYREVFPFVVKRKNDEVHDESKVNIFEAFMIPMSRSASGSESINVVGEKNFTIDQSVAQLYHRDGLKYRFNRMTSICRSSVTFICPDSLKIYLKATPTMQVDNQDIKKLSEQFDKRKPVCDLINDMTSYVYVSLKKQYTATFSSALETYKAGFGDCGEHAVLLAALLRAAGIPARVVFGVIFMPLQSGYFYHAWVNAYNGNEWIFADPAFGVFPANFDRVPLLIDDSGEKMLSLAKVIGRLKIEYVKSK